MTHFWWVRHGPTHQKSFVGWRDVPADLSDTALVSAVAAYLPKDAVLLSSDLQRARQTADAVQTGQPRAPDMPALREINFGAWDGLTHTEVSARDPVIARQYWEQPGEIAPPGGESWNAVSSRVNDAVDQLIAHHTGRNIVVVAHFGVILTQVQRALGCTAYEALGYPIDNLSVTDMRWNGSGWSVGTINHLP